jgi:CRISPR-associated protein Csd1
MILEDAVRPYFAKLKPAEREKYRGLIEKITLGFQDMSQKQLNQRLGEMYLIGYYLQRAEFKKKREKQEDESNEQLTEQD